MPQPDNIVSPGSAVSHGNAASPGSSAPPAGTLPSPTRASMCMCICAYCFRASLGNHTPQKRHPCRPVSRDRHGMTQLPVSSVPSVPSHVHSHPRPEFTHRQLHPSIDRSPTPGFRRPPCNGSHVTRSVLCRPCTALPRFLRRDYTHLSLCMCISVCAYIDTASETQHARETRLADDTPLPPRRIMLRICVCAYASVY